jgi:hypothetical protein
MKNLFYTFLILNVLFVSHEANAQEWLWAKRAGDGGFYHSGTDIVVDSQGNSYVTGHINGATTINFSPTISITTTSTVSSFFLAKYDVSGNVLWVKKVDGLGSGSNKGWSAGTNIALDVTGNIYVVGEFTNDVSFGSTTLTTCTNTGVCAGQTHDFLAKYSNSGDVIWVKKVGAVSASGSGVKGLAVDGLGNSYIIGIFSNLSPATFGSITLTTSSRSGFIAKYNTEGEALWAKKGEVTGTITPTTSISYISIYVDSSGNLYSTGWSSGNSTTFDGNIVSGTNQQGGYIFTVKYNTEGNVVWARNMGNGGARPFNNYVDNLDNVYISGELKHFTAKFGSYSFTSSGDSDIFIVKYDASGNVIWAKKAGGTQPDGVNGGMKLDSQGNIYFAGNFSGTASFGSITLTSAQYGELYIAKYDNLGNAVWVKKSESGNGGGGPECYGFDIGAGGYYVTGKSSHSTNFGTIPIMGTGAGIFAAKLGAGITGIAEKVSSRLEVFPNPLEGEMLTIPNVRGASAKLLTLTGQELRSWTNIGEQISLQNVAAGMYLLEVSQNGQRRTAKVVVK